MSAYYQLSVGHSTQSKTGGKAAFLACLLAGEAATCLGLLASFDYVAQVENRVMTWPAHHSECCSHNTSPLPKSDARVIARCPGVSVGADGTEPAGRCPDLATGNASSCERVSNPGIARIDEFAQKDPQR